MRTLAPTVLQRDPGLLWHPMARCKAGRCTRSTPRADSGSREVIDGIGAWRSMVHGYRNPVLDAAAPAQIDDFSHVMFGGLTHAPTVELAERLVRLAPEGWDHVFLADYSGSVSVEVALKLVLQYQHAPGHTARQLAAVYGHELAGGYLCLAAKLGLEVPAR